MTAISAELHSTLNILVDTSFKANREVQDDSERKVVYQMLYHLTKLTERKLSPEDIKAAQQEYEATLNHIKRDLE